MQAPKPGQPGNPGKPKGRPGRRATDVVQLLHIFSALPDAARVQPCVVRQLFGGMSFPTYHRRVKEGAIPKPTNGTHGVGEIRAALDKLANADVDAA